jgi:heptosyltransferase-1
VHILIVKLGSIGDIVHTLPAAAAIRRHLPSAEISWVVEKRAAEILRENPVIDRLIEIDTKGLRAKGGVDDMLRELRDQVGELRKSRFDLAIDFQGLLKSALVAKVSGARRRWGFAGRALREPPSRILLTDSVKIPRTTHIVNKNLLLASAALGFEPDSTPPEFPIAFNHTDAAEADAIVQGIGPRFAILNPAGGWWTKLWDAANYGRLADRLWDEMRLPSVIVYGPRQEALAQKAAAGSKSGKAVLAQPSLKGLYALAKNAGVYVGGDTGPTHIAIAAGAPIVGIFGPTEWWRNGSLDPRDICVERTDIGCRVNCHRRTCSNWICMDIDVEIVLAGIKKRLAAERVTV